MNASSTLDIGQVADSIDEFWAHRVGAKELARTGGWYRFLVYDAFEVTVTLNGSRVTIEVVGVAPQPRAATTVSAPVTQLNDVLASLDEEMRSSLPDGYLAELDALTRREAEIDAAVSGRRLSPQERRAMLDRTTSSTPTRPAGPTITLDDVAAILLDRFGDRVRIRAGKSAGIDRVEAELDGVLPFAVSRDAQYGAITAALLLGDRAVVSIFGSRLIARHPDEESLREILDLIDLWLDVRRGEAAS